MYYSVNLSQTTHGHTPEKNLKLQSSFRSRNTGLDLGSKTYETCSLSLSQTLEDNMTTTYTLIFSSWLEQKLTLTSHLPTGPKAVARSKSSPKSVVTTVAFKYLLSTGKFIRNTECILSCSMSIVNYKTDGIRY